MAGRSDLSPTAREVEPLVSQSVAVCLLYTCTTRLIVRDQLGEAMRHCRVD